jgi:hypothetical protein
MADPAAAPGATSVMSGIFQTLRDSRCPYLLPGVLCMASLIYVSHFANASERFHYIFLPVGGIFSYLCVLCFFEKWHQDSYSEPQEKKDLESQFKFSRVFCLTVGIAAIVFLFAQSIEPPDPGPWLMVKLGFATAQFQNPADIGQLFWFIYDFSLFHVSIFVFYITLRSVREESVIHISVFQIALFTAAILSGLVVLTSNIHDQEWWLYSCKVTPFTQDGDKKTYLKPFYTCDENTKSQNLAKYQGDASAPPQSKDEVIISPEKLTYWYLFIHLIVFEAFWVYRLFRVVRFKFDVILIDEPKP